MLYVEDLLNGLVAILASNRISDQWRANFIGSVHYQVQTNRQLSTSQGATIVQIASAYKTSMAEILKIPISDITQAIASPKFKNQPYISSVIPREVRYLGSNKLAFRYKNDQSISYDIKACRPDNWFHDAHKPKFYNEYKIWIVPVSESNLEKIQTIIRQYKFDFDNEVLEYLTLCTNSINAKSTFILDAGTNIIYANICNNPMLEYAITNIMNGVEL